MLLQRLEASKYTIPNHLRTFPPGNSSHTPLPHPWMPSWMKAKDYKGEKSATTCLSWRSQAQLQPDWALIFLSCQPVGGKDKIFIHRQNKRGYVSKFFVHPVVLNLCPCCGTIDYIMTIFYRLKQSSKFNIGILSEERQCFSHILSDLSLKVLCLQAYQSGDCS